MLPMWECTQHCNNSFFFSVFKIYSGKTEEVLNSFLPDNNPAVYFLCSQGKKNTFILQMWILKWMCGYWIGKRGNLHRLPFPFQIVHFWNTAWLLTVSFLFCYHSADVCIWDDNSEGVLIHRQPISAGEARFTLTVKGGRGTSIISQNYLSFFHNCKRFSKCLSEVVPGLQRPWNFGEYSWGGLAVSNSLTIFGGFRGHVRARLSYTSFRGSRGLAYHLWHTRVMDSPS